MNQRTRLTWAKKYAILLECERMGTVGEALYVSNVESRAVQNLKLDKASSYRTIKYILTEKQEIVEHLTSMEHNTVFRRATLWLRGLAGKVVIVRLTVQ